MSNFRTIARITSVLCFLGGCHVNRSVSLIQEKAEIVFRCEGPRHHIPERAIYRCAIDIPQPANYNRWLLLTTMMEDPLVPAQEVVAFDILEKLEGFPYCASVRSNHGFDAIPVPAGRPLHVPEWILTTFDARVSLTVWLGAAPSLSNGETLTSIFQRLLDEKSNHPQRDWPPRWSAPQGTLIELRQSGFRSIDIRPLSPWGQRSK